MKDITIEEAVKDLKSLVEEYKDCSVEELNMQVDVGFNEERCRNLEKILNELDTLQNGFNTAVEHQTELIRENTNFRYRLFNNKKELEKKDKIIDAMAEEIEMFGCICTEVFDSTTVCVDKENCIDCIKQYFERRVKDE